MSEITPSPADSIREIETWSVWMQALARQGAALRPAMINPDDPWELADAADAMLASLAKGYLSTFQSDPAHPHWAPLACFGMEHSGTNPDTFYQVSAIDGDGIYRVSGTRGTSIHAILAVTKRFYQLSGVGVPTMGEFELNESSLNADGEVDVMVSAERPDGWDGAWFKLDRTAGILFMRSTAKDWHNETDPVLSIERLDRPVSRPRKSPGQIHDTGVELAAWPLIENRQWMPILKDLKKNYTNKTRLNPWTEGGGLTTQVYYEMWWEMADDEAIILEASAPKNPFYWSVTLNSPTYRVLDWTTRQGSLNDFQSTVDSDGCIRFVLANHDPGVPNWLDVGGYLEGMLMGRWNKCDISPLPDVKVVKLAALRDHLPPDTPVITPAEREARLRHRQRAAQRRRPY